jgi:hypothetical protein
MTKSPTHIISHEDLLDGFISTIVKVVFKHDGVIYGGAVRDWFAQPKSKRQIPQELDVGVQNTTAFVRKVTKCLQVFTIDSKDSTEYDAYENCYCLTIKHNTFPNVSIKMDVNPISSITKSLDFDVNCLNMTSIRQINITLGTDDDLSFGDIMNNILEHKFKILPFTIPKEGTVSKVKHTELYTFIKMQARVAKMLSRNWICEQNIQQWFIPCLIYKVDEPKECPKCKEVPTINYVLTPHCCGISTTKETNNWICFKCALELIQKTSRYHDIKCIFCCGDIFGWKTVQDVIEPAQKKDHAESKDTAKQKGS